MSEVYETVRVREGRVPFLPWHLARLTEGAERLGLAVPDDLEARVREQVTGDELVLRVTLARGQLKVEPRAVPSERLARVIIAGVKHVPYIVKTTYREAFELARAEAASRGAQEALLETTAGFLAEGSITAVGFWAGDLLFPELSLGILPSVGRARLQQLAQELGFGVREGRWQRIAWVGQPLLLVNSVRGVMEVETLDGQPLPRDPRTAKLTRGFWPSTP